MEDIQMEDIDRYRELNGENKSGYYLRTCIKNELPFFQLNNLNPIWNKGGSGYEIRVTPIVK